MKILIIKIGGLGDVLRTTSLLKPLRNKYHGANIWWLTKKDAFELLKNNFLIEKILFIEDIGSNGAILEESFDLVISLDDEEKLCKLASKIKSKKLIGAYYDSKKNRCAYTPEGEAWFGMGLLRPVEKGGLKKANELKAKNKKTIQQHLIEMLGLENKDNEIILNLTDEEKEFGNNFAKKSNISKKDFVVGLNTGAGSRWQLKKLDIKLAIQLAEKLNEMGAKVILFGGPEEEERNKEIKNKVNFKIIDAGVHNSILEFAAIINICSVIITSDSLCLHIASGLAKKIIAFFGPTSSAEIEMYGHGKKILPNMDCVCCYKRDCDKIPNCTESINIDKLLRIVDEIR